MKWEFHDLPTRPMVRIRVRIEAGDANPTQTILNQIPAEVKDKMVRIEIELPEGMRRLIQENRLADVLAPSFDYRVKWLTATAEPIGGPPETVLLTPERLLESFIEVNYAKHKRREELLAKGKEILNEALEK
jgi:hypothetical protein